MHIAPLLRRGPGPFATAITVLVFDCALLPTAVPRCAGPRSRRDLGVDQRRRARRGQARKAVPPHDVGQGHRLTLGRKPCRRAGLSAARKSCTV